VAEPKTVSSLPLDVSIRWAEDQKILQETQPIIRDSSVASGHAQTEVTLPFKQAEIDALLGIINYHSSWANFQNPPGFLHQKRRIFTSQLASFLGSDEQQDSVIARIQSTQGESQDSVEWEKEKDRFVKLYLLLQSLNKDLIDIINRCKQYQKG
jgi:hypothetical protein